MTPFHEFERAAEVFARGFCFTRSFTHPFVPERVGAAWWLRDAPRSGGEYRREEWIAHDVEPTVLDRLARRHTRGRFVICAFSAAGESHAPLRAEYKALGYRLGATEAFMVQQLKRIPRIDAPAAVAIARVRTEELAGRVARAAGARQILPEHLIDRAPLRAYVALKDNEPVGWVRSIVVGEATWCSNMFVVPQHRRRRIGSALLSAMLRDDRKHGATLAVLLASHTGAKLYPTAGYEQIGTLLMFSPVRRKTG